MIATHRAAFVLVFLVGVGRLGVVVGQIGSPMFAPIRRRAEVEVVVGARRVHVDVRAVESSVTAAHTDRVRVAGAYDRGVARRIEGNGDVSRQPLCPRGDVRFSLVQLVVVERTVLGRR